MQERIPAWHGPVSDPENGGLISSHVMNQDFVAWVGQGVIADRPRSTSELVTGHPDVAEAFAERSGSRGQG